MGRLRGVAIVGAALALAGATGQGSAALRGSPDLAFVRGKYVPGHIWRLLPDGSRRRLTYGVGEEYPAWSPDGRWLVYVGYAKRPQGAGAETDLYVIDADGRNRRRITRNRGREYDPAWSPDGRRIAFACHNPTGGLDLCIVSSSGGTPRRLMRTDWTCEAQPQWTPDGRRLHFSTCGNGDMYVIPAAGGRPTLLFPSLGGTWSPDGLSFVHGGGSALYLEDANGANERQLLAPDSSSVDDVTWSPDGTQLSGFTDARSVCGAAEYRTQLVIIPVVVGASVEPLDCLPTWDRHPVIRPHS